MPSVSTNILFVFEGERREEAIVRSLSNYYLQENIIITTAYCADIYQFYNDVKSDDFVLFRLLKELRENKNTLASFDRDSFSEIYLFFDYDGHATNANNANISDLISIFNDEFEFGKLFIHYPMVEALIHISEDINFKKLTVSASDNIRYKKLVGDEGASDLKRFNKISEGQWKEIIKVHLLKMSFIINDVFDFPERLISQEEIFNSQLSKYIEPMNHIAVLSGFPPFLLDYYGVDKMVELLK